MNRWAIFKLWIRISGFGLLSGFGLRGSDLQYSRDLLPAGPIHPPAELAFVAALAGAALGLGFEAAAQMNQAVRPGIGAEFKAEVGALDATDAIDVLDRGVASPLIWVVVRIHNGRTDNAGQANNDIGAFLEHLAVGLGLQAGFLLRFSLRLWYVGILSPPPEDGTSNDNDHKNCEHKPGAGTGWA